MSAYRIKICWIVHILVRLIVEHIDLFNFRRRGCGWRCALQMVADGFSGQLGLDTDTLSEWIGERQPLLFRGSVERMNAEEMGVVRPKVI